MINRRSFLAVYLVLLSVLMKLTTAAPSQHPNILMIVSDDQSACMMGAYGNRDIITSALDYLAAEGMRFERAYVTSPQCLPSRCSMMTGQGPIRIGVSRFTAPLPPEVKTFPELLRDAGYFTGLAGRDHHLQGWTHSDTIREIYARNGWLMVNERFDIVRETDREYPEMGQFMEVLDAVPDGKPFFIQMGFKDPHRGWSADAQAKQYDPRTLSLPPGFPDTPLLRKDLAQFYGEVTRLDSNVAKVLRILDQRKLTSNTIIVFIGDNGAALLRGKGTLYEMGIRVPLLIKWPGVVKPGSVASQLVSGEDLAPTLLEVAGVKPPVEMTGKSFLPLLRGKSFKGRDSVYAERGAHGAYLPRTTFEFDLSRTVVSTTYKLIYNATWQLPYAPVDITMQPFWIDLKTRYQRGILEEWAGPLLFAPTRPMFELYDLENDPWELINLAGKAEYKDIEYDLKLQLTEWMIQQRDFVPLPIYK